MTRACAAAMALVGVLAGCSWSHASPDVGDRSRDQAGSAAAAEVERAAELCIERRGLPSGTVERVWLEGGSLHHEIARPNGMVDRSPPIVMTDERLSDLRDTLDRLGVWRWRDAYSNDYIVDGVHMTVDVGIDGRSISVRMSNRGPAFVDDGRLTHTNVGLGLGEDLLRELRDLFRPPRM